MRICGNCGTSIEHKKKVARSCSVACNQAILLARRTAAKWEGVDPDRGCESCNTSMRDRRPHARYCSRVCKAAGSSVRRESDGRGRLKAGARRTKTRKKISPLEIGRLLNRQLGKCAYCPKDIRSRYHIDHIVPLSRGGVHSIGNIALACPSCNCSKKNQFLVEWRHKASDRGGR